MLNKLQVLLLSESQSWSLAENKLSLSAISLTGWGLGMPFPPRSLPRLSEESNNDLSPRSQDLHSPTPISSLGSPQTRGAPLPSSV